MEHTTQAITTEGDLTRDGYHASPTSLQAAGLRPIGDVYDSLDRSLAPLPAYVGESYIVQVCMKDRLGYISPISAWSEVEKTVREDAITHEVPLVD